MLIRSSAEPKNTNFCKHLYVDKITSPANLRANRRRPLPSDSRRNIIIEFIGKFIIDILVLYNAFHISFYRLN